MVRNVENACNGFGKIFNKFFGEKLEKLFSLFSLQTF